MQKINSMLIRIISRDFTWSVENVRPKTISDIDMSVMYAYNSFLAHKSIV